MSNTHYEPIEWTEEFSTKRFKNCSCSSIIYEDVKKYMFEIPQFKKLFSILTKRNLRSNYENYKKFLSLITGEYNAYNYSIDHYLYYDSNETQKEYWDKSYSEKIKSKYS